MPQGSQGNDQSAYRVILAYVVIGIVLLFLSRTRVGATLIYYVLVLILFFLIVTQFQFFQWALSPFRNAGQWLANRPANNNTP